MVSLQNKTLKVILLTALKYTCISKKKTHIKWFFCVCCLQWPVHGLFCVSLTGMGMDGKGHRDPASTSRSWLSHAVFVMTYQAALHLFWGGLSGEFPPVQLKMFNWSVTCHLESHNGSQSNLVCGLQKINGGEICLTPPSVSLFLNDRGSCLLSRLQSPLR